MIEYQDRLEICGNRNNYSKTDYDTIFMKVKEDPMQNSQLKLTYNIRLNTSNQYIFADTVYGIELNCRYLEDNFLENVELTFME